MNPAIKRYIMVAKPGIVFGNLISVAGGFFLASRGEVDIRMLLAALTGTSLVVASACVFNNYIDREVDRRMDRTRNRVLARGLMSPRAAFFHGSLLGIAGTAVLLAATNLLSLAIVLGGFVIYVIVYSLIMKRRSVYSTLVGSIAGAAPPLAGYCAVTHSFDPGAVMLLSIFSLWQIPHSHAIAVFRIRDYTAATIPVLPVKRGLYSAKKHIVGYILAYTAATLMLTIGGYTGFIFLAVTAATGLLWFGMAWSGFRAPDAQLWGKRLFIFSILSITLLNVMMAIDFRMPPIFHAMIR